MEKPFVEQAEHLASQVAELFCDRDPGLIGATLAELLSLWLLSHFVEGDESATNEMRSRLLYQHIKGVQILMDCNAARLNLSLMTAAPVGSA